MGQDFSETFGGYDLMSYGSSGLPIVTDGLGWMSG
jgi:hypothetical protein